MYPSFHKLPNQLQNYALYRDWTIRFGLQPVPKPAIGIRDKCAVSTSSMRLGQIILIFPGTFCRASDPLHPPPQLPQRATTSHFRFSQSPSPGYWRSQLLLTERTASTVPIHESDQRIVVGLVSIIIFFYFNENNQFVLFSLNG